MKLLLSIALLLTSFPSFAFDLKEMAEKIAKDKKTQEQLKDAAKKGMEYFQKDDKKSEEESAATDPKEEKKI